MTFHNEIYTIYKVFRGSPMVYKLIDETDGETIFGRFYEWELQRVEALSTRHEDPSRAKLASGSEATEPKLKGPMNNYVMKNK